MNLIVDRIENNIVVCQDLDSKKIREVNKKDINFKVSDGDIIIFKDGKYFKDDDLKNNRLSMIKNKMERLKSIKK